MPKTYADVMKEIDGLKAEAEALKRREVGDVVARIKEAIAVYGLTAADLFGRGRGRPAGRAKAGASGARYGDGAGNVWGGRGPRPKWLRDALASGKQLSDFEMGGSAKPAKARKAAAKKKRRGGSVRYRDDAGNTWSGFGPKPGWFKAALAAGKRPEDLAV
jgi:DNA-binding protein H-NS